MVILCDDQRGPRVELEAGECHRTFLAGEAFASGLAGDISKCPGTSEWFTGPSHTVGLHLTASEALERGHFHN